MAFEISEWFNQISKDEVLFQFRGEVTVSLITDSLDQIEETLADAPSRIRKKVYNVSVELLQNLYHHSAVIPEELNREEKGRYVVYLLSRNKVGYHIHSGNFIQKEQKDFLSNHLQSINNLSRDELKALYKEILDNQEFSEKGGGGLGMVDMARKSGSKLNYFFEDIGNKLYFFTFNVNIVE